MADLDPNVGIFFKISCIIFVIKHFEDYISDFIFNYLLSINLQSPISVL